MARETWVQLRDAIYVAEAAARDAEMDLASVERPTDARAVAASLISAIDALASTSTEPKAASRRAYTSP